MQGLYKCCPRWRETYRMSPAGMICLPRRSRGAAEGAGYIQYVSRHFGQHLLSHTESHYNYEMRPMIWTFRPYKARRTRLFAPWPDPKHDVTWLHDATEQYDVARVQTTSWCRHFAVEVQSTALDLWARRPGEGWKMNVKRSGRNVSGEWCSWSVPAQK
jgi:hypothetical protein